VGHREVIRPVLEAAQAMRQQLGQGDSPNDGYPDDSIDVSVLDLASLTLFRGYSERQFSIIDSDPPAPPKAVQAAPLATVLTFYPHPQEYFSGVSRPLLTPIDEKALQLKEMGVDQLVLLPFNQELASLSPEQFVDLILVRHLQARHISVGVDFRFGHRRSGSAEDLQTLANRQGITVTLVPLLQDSVQGASSSADRQRISSSRIRAALEQADLTTAAQLLGRPYSLTGRVVQGQQLGRTIGFPTANLKVPAEKFLPCNGVYSVRVFGVKADPRPYIPGVMNIGNRPTVNGMTQTIEVHLLQWSGDLYGQTLRVTLDAYLRPEKRFESLDSLKRQIQADCDAALAR
jgi:riboflavin kinase / FMN adenylyltransferase